MEHNPAKNEPDNLAARRILAVTKEELQRIVLDIHDGPVQSLFAVLTQINLGQKRRTRGEIVSPQEYGQLLTRLSTLTETILNGPTGTNSAGHSSGNGRANGFPSGGTAVVGYGTEGYGRYPFPTRG
jgi:hypothetical protein